MVTKICEIIAKNNNLLALQNEDVLENSYTVVEIPTAIKEISKCKDHLLIAGNSDVNLTMDSIQYNAFDALFSDATLLRGVSRQPYVTGLRVHLGLNNSEIVLLFQPTCLIKSTDPNEPKRYYVSDGLFYIYAGMEEKFVPARTQELSYITNYQSTIQIKHLGKNIYEGLIPNVDTTSIIIPFQVIFSLVYDNDENTDVFLFNSIVTSANKLNHTVLMGTGNDEDGHSLMGGYTGKYADRSHLCPPCNYVDDLIISSPGPTTCP